MGKYDKICHYSIHDFLFTTIPRSLSSRSTDSYPSSNPSAWLLTCSKTRRHRWPLIQHSTSPAFTGTLDLILLQEVEHIARRLLCTQNSLHPRKLKLPRTQEDGLRWINVLVASESAVRPYLCLQEIRDTSINLSKATRLKSVARKHRDLRQTLINVPFDFPPEAPVSTLNESLGKLHMDPDRLPVQFWESHMIRPKIRHSGVSRREKKDAIDRVRRLLPEMTKRVD